MGQFKRLGAMVRESSNNLLSRDNNPCTWHGVGCSNASSNASHVVSLVLVENGLQGELPSELSQLSTLGSLDLNNNQLHGKLPPELCNIGDNLKVLSLWDNGLSGSIPVCYGSDFTRLQTLSLESNELSGSLPSLHGIGDTLEYLWIYNNSFTGTLEVLDSMKALNTIELRSNSFSGSIPVSLCNLGTLLQNIVMWSNSLTGQVDIQCVVSSLAHVITCVFRSPTASVSWTGWRYWHWAVTRSLALCLLVYVTLSLCDGSSSTRTPSTDTSLTAMATSLP